MYLIYKLIFRLLLIHNYINCYILFQNTLNILSWSQSTLAITTLPGSGNSALILSAALSKIGASKLLKRHHCA